MRRLKQLAGLCVLIAVLITRSDAAHSAPGRVVTVSSPQIAGGSIVYVKDGNVWLADPAGTIKRQLTSGGGYRSPSVADDGTVGVLRDVGSAVEFVRLSPTGTVLGRGVRRRQRRLGPRVRPVGAYPRRSSSLSTSILWGASFSGDR